MFSAQDSHNSHIHLLTILQVKLQNYFKNTTVAQNSCDEENWAGTGLASQGALLTQHLIQRMP